MSKLYQLPDGSWTDPSYIKCINSLDLTELHGGGYIGPRVVIIYNNRQSIIEYNTFESACKVRDKIAKDVNELRRK